MTEATDADRINLLANTPFGQAAMTKVIRSKNAAGSGEPAASAPSNQGKFLRQFTPEERLAQQRALAQRLKNRP